ncbi:MAG: hypothetical protein HC796_05470 [Synechococcaceae cyanobacterium RL_1_2]|nr:hypothetical protein [Synechococcaceae cyanobacterium RL_1_2]
MWPFQDSTLPNPTSSSFTWLQNPERQTIAKVDLLEPEFPTTQAKVPFTEDKTYKTPAAVPSWKPVQSSTSSLVPRSNNQLFNQKQAALKAGKLHSTLKADSFADKWLNNNQPVTYQDWKNLLAQEAKSLAKGQGNNRLNIMVGDSLSLWFPSESLPKGKFWLNQSISGENTGQILNRIDAIAPTKVSTIYIMAGVMTSNRGLIIKPSSTI